jgi:hypothetical protein
MSFDITALGREEKWEDSPEGYPQTPPYTWWRWHDAYDEAQPSAERLDQIDRYLDQIGRGSESPGDSTSK